MEGINSLQDLIRREDFLVKIDLKDAYLTIPIREEDKNFFSHLFGGGAYCISFRALRLVSPLPLGYLLKYLSRS